jgi:hypothetical protein
MITFIVEFMWKDKAYHGLQESVPDGTCLIFQIEGLALVGVSSIAFLHRQLFQVRSQHKHGPLQKNKYVIQGRCQLHKYVNYKGEMTGNISTAPD